MFFYKASTCFFIYIFSVICSCFFSFPFPGLLDNNLVILGNFAYGQDFFKEWGWGEAEAGCTLRFKFVVINTLSPNKFPCPRQATFPSFSV